MPGLRLNVGVGQDSTRLPESGERVANTALSRIGAAGRGEDVECSRKIDLIFRAIDIEELCGIGINGFLGPSDETPPAILRPMRVAGMQCPEAQRRESGYAASPDTREQARVADEPDVLFVRDGALWRELLAADTSAARKTPSVNGSSPISPFNCIIQTRPFDRLRFRRDRRGFQRAVELVPMHLSRPHTIKERSKHVRERAVERGRFNGDYRVCELVYRSEYAPGLD
jgi:hypothetical protein